MKLIKACAADFSRLTKFYRYTVENTENMRTFGRWIYGLHPSDEMIMRYLQNGEMYYAEKNGTIIAAAAVTPQAAEYHETNWLHVLPDDAVSVIHILCVDPLLQKQGIARNLVESIINMSREIGRKSVRLDVIACNTPAQRLYEAMGFVKCDEKFWYASNLGYTTFFLYKLPLD